MRRSAVLAGIIPLAICLPCLIPLLIVAGIGTGAFTATGAWFSDNGLGLGAAAAALAFATLAGIIYVRRARAAACDSDVQQAARTSER